MTISLRLTTAYQIHLSFNNKNIKKNYDFHIISFMFFSSFCITLLQLPVLLRVQGQNKTEDDRMTIYFMKMTSMKFFLFSPALVIEYWAKKEGEGKKTQTMIEWARGTIINQNLDDMYWSILYAFLFSLWKENKTRSCCCWWLLLQYRRFSSFSFII